MEENPVSEVKTNQPTLWDLIDVHFPEPFRTTYLDAERVFKEAEAALLRKLYQGIRADDCKEKEMIKSLVIEAKKANPKWKAPAIYQHLKEYPEEAVRISIRQRKHRTVLNWIRNVISEKIPNPDSMNQSEFEALRRSGGGQ
jgi:hypothetical protein